MSIFLRSLLVILTAAFFVACNKGKNNPDSCNGKNTRRSVKIAVDELASEIDTVAIDIDVAEIGALDVPETDEDSPRQTVEKKVYRITAKVHKLSKHRDGDWKVKLTDGNDKFVNCESPNMGCEYISPSIFYNEMSDVRAWIEAHKDELVGKTVTITGVAFIDIDHKYPRNAADNEVELHPILDIHY